MDMTTRKNGEDDDPFHFHKSLVASIVQVCCLTSLARREDAAEHRADMLLLADMIAAELLCHAYPDLSAEHLASAVTEHAGNVVTFYAHRIRHVD